MSFSSESPRKCRIVLCMGQYCNRGGQAEPLYNRLTELLGERRPAWSSTGPVLWEIATCLSMCGGGPNLVVYPDDIACNHLDIATLEAVIEDVLQRANSGG